MMMIIIMCHDGKLMLTVYKLDWASGYYGQLLSIHNPQIRHFYPCVTKKIPIYAFVIPLIVLISADLYYTGCILYIYMSNEIILDR